MHIFVLFFLSLANLYSQSLDVNEAVTDFSGGLNNANPSIYIKNNESPNLINVEIDNPVGVLKQRKGYIKVANSPSGNQITNMYEYVKVNGDRWLLLTDNYNIWATMDLVNFTTITYGLNGAYVPYFKTIRDKVWIVNPSTDVITFDGSSISFLDGSGTKPDVPKGNYIEYWKERVWIARTGDEASGIYFSNLVDENGIDIEPSLSTSAWSASNLIYINREDGSPIYAIKAYKDNLYVFKETGIWAIIFESELNIQLVKLINNVGCKFQNSVVEMDDGLLYFLGKDGVYSFDGRNTVRISDNIQPVIDAIKQQSGSERYKLWDTATDFLNGTLTGLNTYYYENSLSLNSIDNYILLDNFSDGDYTSNPTWIFYGSYNKFSVSSGELKYMPAATGNYTGLLYTSTETLNYGSWKFQSYHYRAGSNFEFYFISSSSSTTNTNGYKIRFEYNGGIITCYLYKVISGSSAILTSSATSGGTSFFWEIIRNYDGEIIVKKEDIILFTYTDNSYTGNSNYIMIYADVGTTTDGYFLIDNIYLKSKYVYYGTYTSEISTFTGLSRYLTFEADSQLNGQSIQYYIRTGDTIDNLLNSDWNSIKAGNIISTTTNQYIQWKADFTTYDNSYTPILNSVTLNYKTGANVNTLVQGINYKNRYYLTVSTSPANQYNDMVIVKSKSPLISFTLFDYDISAYTMFNNLFYGAISNTDSIVRLDYGENDDGNAITSYWESKDLIFGYPFFYKQINESIVSYEKGINNNLNFGFSSDRGKTWTTRTLDTSLTSLDIDFKRFNFNIPSSPTYRFRVYNNQIDKNYTIFGIFNFGKLYNYKGQ